MIMNTPDNNTQLSDEQLSQLLKNNIPRRLPAPWFTRKVLNRLPPRSILALSIVEYLAYTAAIAVCSVYLYGMVDKATDDGSMTVNALVTMIGLTSMIACLVFMVIAPFARKQILHRAD